MSEQMPFKRGDVVLYTGDVVVYTGEEPRFPDPDRIGSVGIVVRVVSSINVRVHWFWDARPALRLPAKFGVYPNNLKKLGEVDYDEILKGIEGTHSRQTSP